MAQTNSFIIELKALLPESSWPWVISALRQDHHFWNRLNDPVFCKRALAELGSDPQKWNPASLALLDLVEDSHPDKSSKITPDLRQRALRVFESYSQAGYPDSEDKNSLKEMGLAAIALYEHRRLSGSWSGLHGDLKPIPQAFWPTILACLYAIAPDKVSLLKQFLIPGTSRRHHDLALHALLSNPIPPAEQAKTIQQLCVNLPMPDVVSILRRLHLSRPSLAKDLAHDILNAQPTFADERKFSTSIEQVSHLANLLFHAELNNLAAHGSQSVDLHAQVVETVDSLQGVLAWDLLDAVIHAGEVDQAISLWENIQSQEAHPDSTIGEDSPPSNLVVALLSSGRISDALELYSGQAVGNYQQQSPSQLLVLAHQAASNGDLSEARKFARWAVAAVRDLRGEIGIPLSVPSDVESEGRTQHGRKGLSLLTALTHTLLNLNEPAPAAQIAELAVSLRPNDAEVLNSLAHTCRIAGETGRSLDAAHLAVGLAPENLHIRREFAACLESASQWALALQERRAILEKRRQSSNNDKPPLASDIRALASCAIRAGKALYAIEVTSRMIEEDPEDGMAHALLAQALQAGGETERAFHHYRLATEVSPHLARPWLAFADACLEDGQPVKAIEVLRSATQAVPDDPTIHLALAEVYLGENALTQALTSLQHAYGLVTQPHLVSRGATWQKSSFGGSEVEVAPPHTALIALRLGQTLHDLGHLDQAHKILEQAFEEYPTFPGLAHTFGRTLLDSADPAKALAPLKQAMEINPHEAWPYIDYARALLQLGSKPNEAVAVLQSALKISPKHPHALAYLASAFEANGEFQDAMQTYYLAMETELSKDASWQGRLSFGLGRVALQIGHHETAIAALHESLRVDDKNPAIHCSLVEAYLAIRLPEEALQSARTALQLNPDDVETLTWFAGHASALGVSHEAISALSRAVQLSPEDAGLLIRLGRVQSQVGKSDDARVTFKNLLEIESPDIDHLQQAAHELLALDDPKGAIACLEYACKLNAKPVSGLLVYLARAYQQSGDSAQALETIDKAIVSDPTDISLHLAKIDLLAESDRPAEVQRSLEEALKIHPENPQLHYWMALLKRAAGQPETALTHAKKMIAGLGDQSIDAIGARGLAADLARSLLQPVYARKILDENPLEVSSEVDKGYSSISPKPSFIAPSSILSAYCLATELALEEGEEIAAAETLTHAVRNDSENPRVLALQARLTSRRGDHETAAQLLQSLIGDYPNPYDDIVSNGAGSPGKQGIAFQDLAETSEVRSGHIKTLQERQDRINTVLGLATAALELGQWDLSLDLLRMIVKSAGAEPFSHLLLARGLTLRAEYQGLCKALDVVAHAPGDSALSDYARDSFDEAIEQAKQLMPRDNPAFTEVAEAQIRVWEDRGQTVFHDPSTRQTAPLAMPAIQSHNPNATNIYAHGKDLESVAKAQQAALKALHASLKHPLVLAHWALSLGYQSRRISDLEKAMDTARFAIEVQPVQPIYHALLAYLARKSGDLQTALDSIQTALSLWPDESRWHNVAAELHLALSQVPDAIDHLNHAMQFEPKNLDHYLLLAEAHAHNGETAQAIKSLEQALFIAPDHVDAHLSLAQIYFRSGDFKKAAIQADRALQLAPDRHEALILSAEIALETGDARTALERAQNASHSKPQDFKTLQLLIRSLYRLNRTEEAIKLLDEAAPNVADPMPILLERIRLMEDSKGAKAALSALQDLIASYPDEPGILGQLARTLSKEGHREEAIQAAQRALHLQDEDMEITEQASLHHLLGRLLRETGQLDQALLHLSQAIQLSPDMLEPYLDLAATQQERRQYAQALQTYRKAIDVAPNDPRAYYQASLALKDSRDYRAAEDMLRCAANLAPDDAVIHRQLAALVALNLVHNQNPVSIET